MKTKIQKLKSSKLFFNKWPFKVECTVRGASRIDKLSIGFLKKWCISDKIDAPFKGPGYDKIDKAEFLSFINAAESFLDRSDLQIRKESSHFNIFCKDMAVLEEIETKLKPWLRKISGPTTTEELEFLLSNGHKKVLCDTLPKQGYKYKVYFKYKFPADKRINFLNWAANYQDKIIISITSKKWLLGSKYYVQSPFMYVKDEKMLSLVGMFLSGYVSRVDEFIERNTVLVA